jgi:hypothetical protein
MKEEEEEVRVRVKLDTLLLWPLLVVVVSALFCGEGMGAVFYF